MRWQPVDDGVRDVVLDVCRAVRDEGGRALLVGGCVRDALLERAPVDHDLEVYGVEPERLESLLSSRHDLDRTGRAFGVLKLRGAPVDVSLPRRESKAGLGHRGFLVQSDPDLTPREAALRRDFTLNAIAYDPLTGEVVDPVGGRGDLERRVLRRVSERFAEDPLRVLRGMQLVARFELTADPETVTACRGLDPEGLARERIFEEWRKLLLLGARPSLGLAFLRDTGWLDHFPELAALVGCAQDPEWHPEGDAWIHTGLCLDAFAAERTGDEREDLIVGLAVLCHDLGKPATTRFADGRLRSPGHLEAGEAPARALLARLTPQRDLVEQVVPLVREHSRPYELHRAAAGDAAIRRLAHRVGRIDRLVRVARADRLGRGDGAGPGFPAGDWLLERAAALDVRDAPPQPLVLGRHLIGLGLAPGPGFKTLLDECYEAQLAGRIATVEEGVALATKLAR
ncbi:MAG: HD domain-containing protein [bacterium]|nr:HD domain-containing protein [bacterium]